MTRRTGSLHCGRFRDGQLGRSPPSFSKPRRCRRNLRRKTGRLPVVIVAEGERRFRLCYSRSVFYSEKRWGANHLLSLTEELLRRNFLPRLPLFFLHDSARKRSRSAGRNEGRCLQTLNGKTVFGFTTESYGRSCESIVLTSSTGNGRPTGTLCRSNNAPANSSNEKKRRKDDIAATRRGAKESEKRDESEKLKEMLQRVRKIFK